MLNSASADRLAEQLDDLLPEYEVSTAPWDHVDGEWIVSVWDGSGKVLVDVFEADSSRTPYIVREPGFGGILARTPDVQGVRGAVRRYVNGGMR